MNAASAVVKASRNAVAAIETDIERRKGLGNEWEEIPDEVRADIRTRWVAFIVEAIAHELSSLDKGGEQ